MHPLSGYLLTKYPLLGRLKIAIRWICSNWDREASVSNMKTSLCMKKLKNRRSIPHLKMMQDLITGEKQICKKSLPVRQRVVLLCDLNNFMEV